MKRGACDRHIKCSGWRLFGLSSRLVKRTIGMVAKMRKLNTLLAVILFASLLVVIVVGCQQQSTLPPPQPPPLPAPSPPTATPAPSETEQEYVPNQIIVMFKPGTPVEAQEQLHQELGTTVIHTSPSAGFKVLQIPEGKTVEEMVAIYSEQSIVEYAEPNYIEHLSPESK